VSCETWTNLRAINNSMFFQPIPSQTHTQSLDDVLDNLRQHTNVEAVLTLGSTATGKQNSSSDYDLLVILHQMPFPMQVLLTTINGRLTDVLFAPSNLLTRLLNNEPQSSFHPYETIVIEHMWTGKIVFDGNGRLAQVRTKLSKHSWQATPTDEEIYYRIIHGINFNYQHNKRYHSNPDPLYQMVLDIRLNYSVDQIISGYFLMRKLAWQGEKKAIQYWQEYDPAFFANFQKYFGAHRNEKFAIYTDLAQQVLAPAGGLWPADSVNIVLDGDWRIDDVPKAVDYWHSLTTLHTS
jgi:predicted nucleotidyltransferase